MNILEFTKQFPTERSCKEHIRDQCEPDCSRRLWKQGRGLYQT